MESSGEKWYSDGWTLDIKNQSWVENTSAEVDFIISKLGLGGGEKILDLACGYGRHSLELARRGFTVVGVDITQVYVDDANKTADEEKLSAKFIQSDIRNISFENEFDVVLNLADGAIGYLENDEENAKIFQVLSKALKSGGKSFMDIMSADYADAHFPVKMWDSGEKGLTLSIFEWNEKTRVMMYGQRDYEYGQPLEKPEFSGNPTRLYGEKEIGEILGENGMSVVETYCDYTGKMASEKGVQLMVYSEKK